MVFSYFSFFRSLPECGKDQSPCAAPRIGLGGTGSPPVASRRPHQLSAQVQGSAKRAVLFIAQTVNPKEEEEAGKEEEEAAAVGGAEEKGTDE